jgi:hypothetical protein
MQTEHPLRQLAELFAKLSLCVLTVASADATTLPARDPILSNGQQVSSSAVPMLGTYTLLGQENQNGVSPATTAAITTQSSGSSFVVFSAGDVSNSNPQSGHQESRELAPGVPCR